MILIQQLSGRLRNQYESSIAVLSSTSHVRARLSWTKTHSQIMLYDMKLPCFRPWSCGAQQLSGRPRNR